MTLAELQPVFIEFRVSGQGFQVAAEGASHSGEARPRERASAQRQFLQAYAGCESLNFFYNI